MCSVHNPSNALSVVDKKELSKYLVTFKEKFENIYLLNWHFHNLDEFKK